MQSDITPSAPEIFAANRAMGVVRFDVQARDGVTRRRELHESGSLRVRFPSPEHRGLSATLINTAGGIAGGDRFDIAATAGPGAGLTVTTAAAEKVYRSHGPDAAVNIALRAEADSRLVWLPQETILFDQARVCRKIDIELAESASLVLCEIVVFGRAAMGERMTRGHFTDRWRLRIGGKLAFAENVRLDGEIGRKLALPAIASGGVAIGTMLIVPGDEVLVACIRDGRQNATCETGVSAWNGFAMARFCAQDAAQLRAEMAAMLQRATLSHLPRLWLN